MLFADQESTGLSKRALDYAVILFSFSGNGGSNKACVLLTFL